MSPSANVLSIQAIEDLKTALSRFGNEAQEALSAAEPEIRRTLDWLQERLNHWQNEVHRQQIEVDHARSALARCEASGYRDEQGYYHAPNCSTYEQALLQAKLCLQEAEAELRNVQQWTRVVQQTAADYHSQAQRLNALLGNDLARATALLGHNIAALQAYVGRDVPLNESVMVRAESASTSVAEPTLERIITGSEQPKGITWAEYRAIFEKWGSGNGITLEELDKLRLPISDLQTGSVQEDNSWAYDLLEGQRFLDMMRNSQEARDLRDAILATLKAINYWRSKS